MNVAALLGAENVARAANLEVAHGDVEPGPELRRRQHGLQPLLGGLGHAAGLGYHQIGVGAPGATPHPASKLVQLREAEGVRAVYYQRVDVGDIEAGLDDRGAHEHVQLALGKVQHGLLELVLRHLAVPNADGGLGDQHLDIVGHVADVVDPVVQEVDLTLPVELPQNGLANQLVAEL